MVRAILTGRWHVKAVWYEATGSANKVLRLGETPAPKPEAGEVGVRVHASGINPSDTKRRDGWNGLPMLHPRIIPHSDGAGIIEAIGEGVDQSRIGERVWLWNAQGTDRPFGTAAEYTTIPDEQAVKLPNGVDFSTGAGLGVPGCTAHYAVFGNGPVGGQRLLVQGGAGAVGYLAVQLATLGGAHVIATVSGKAKMEMALAAGAHEVINYREEDVVDRIDSLTAGEGVDRVIEVDLSANLQTDVAVLRPNGSIASYSSTSNPSPRIDYYPLAFKDLKVHFVQGYLLPAISRRSALNELTTWLGAGQLDVKIGARYGLDETVLAHETLESGDTLGQIVIEL